MHALKIDGKYALKITHAPAVKMPRPYEADSVGPAVFASLWGWTRGWHEIGEGATPAAAVQDWCRQTGNDPSTVFAEFVFVNPAGETIAIDHSFDATCSN